jgi:serine/threonine-protein kinase RsbW
MNVRTSTRLRRERSAVPSARAFVRHALRAVGASGDVVERLELAVAEACNNAILHAAGATFSVSVAVDGDRVMVAITDAGDGFRPPAKAVMPSPLATGHRGLPLMEALVDQVDVSSNGHGTTVVLVQALAPGARGAAVTVDG